MGLAKREVWAWLLLAAAAVSVNTVRHSGPIVSDDSFQYLSIAENLADGNGIRTSIVHFDQERSHGEIPAPVTWFPAGYPANYNIRHGSIEFEYCPSQTRLLEKERVIR